MAWSFRRRIKIIPGVHLNFSKNGISTSIGVRGASLTFSQKGTYLNTGIPGTGIYNRQKISSDSSPQYLPQPTPGVTPTDNIFSVDIQQVTSQDMQGIKEAIIAANAQRKDLERDVKNIKLSLAFSYFKMVAVYLILFGFFVKSLVALIRKEITDKKDAIRQLKIQIKNSCVKLDVGFDPDIRTMYERVVSAFKLLTNSQKIWDVTGAYANDRVTTRSAASTSIKTIQVRFGIKTLEAVTSEFEPLWMKNANGADLYFYPGFVVMYSTQTSFAVVGLAELNFTHNSVRYVETSGVPSDSKIIDRTWAKVNKNGAPDRRFKNNYEIPIVRYGAILLSTETGLHEEYMFSNYEASEEFARDFTVYQKLIKSLRPIPIG
jgi:hypothetical protein